MCLDCGAEFQPPGQTGVPPERCESCRAARRRALSAEKARRWREANPDRAREQWNKHNRKRLANPEHLQAKRDAHMLRRYGLTVADFESLLTQQDGVCAICKGEPNGPGNRFHVDHCHESSKVRGLLCSRCNTAIGLLEDDPERAEQAAAYLRR